MAIRFRKTIKIAPGVRINIGKTGISTSLGPKGATVNLRGGKRKLTTGIPGSGLSHTQDITPRAGRTSGVGSVAIAIVILMVIGWSLS